MQGLSLLSVEPLDSLTPTPIRIQKMLLKFEKLEHWNVLLFKSWLHPQTLCSWQIQKQDCTLDFHIWQNLYLHMHICVFFCFCFCVFGI